MEFTDDIIDPLSVDCVVFGFNKKLLYALLVKHDAGVAKGKWGLPGSWIKYNEAIDSAAYRILTSQTGVSNIFLEQFQTFGELDRFPGKRVITVCYFALVNTDFFELTAGKTIADAQWFEIDKLPNMAFDHRYIFDKCLVFLKHKIQYEPIGFNLLPNKFTLFQLQELYEAILGISLDKSNFRRKFLKMNLLIKCDEKQNDVAHRAANLYQFDKNAYDHLIEKGFSFEF